MSISPNVPTPQESSITKNTGTPRWIAVLFGVLIVAVAGVGLRGSLRAVADSRPISQGAGSEQALHSAARSGQLPPRRAQGQHEVTQQKIGITAAELAKAAAAPNRSATNSSPPIKNSPHS